MRNVMRSRVRSTAFRRKFAEVRSTAFRRKFAEVRSTAFRRKFVAEVLRSSTNFRLKAVLRTLLGRKFVAEVLRSSTNFRLKAVLRTLLGLMVLVAVVALAVQPDTQSANGSSRIEIVEVKNVGISAANDAKSVIQVRWAARFPPETSVKSFDVSLEVRYADQAKERVRVSVDGSASSARFEVPTLHLSPGRPAAEMRSFEASVTANASESATKQGNL
jgi:hypothetical protein